jgi:hypothetical protein
MWDNVGLLRVTEEGRELLCHMWVFPERVVPAAALKANREVSSSQDGYCLGQKVPHSVHNSVCNE